MNEFLLIFRRDAGFENKFSPGQLQQMARPWQEWMADLSAKGLLADNGNRLHSSGKVLKAEGLVTDGPYVEVKELVSGYMLIKAGSMDEAVLIAGGCPILKTGGCVEVREIITMN